MFRTVCPHCFREYMLEETFLGKVGTCAGCKKTFELKEATRTQIRSRIRTSPGQTGTQPDSGFELQIPANGGEALGISDRFPETQSLRLTDGRGNWKIGDLILGTYEVLELAPGVPFAEGGVGIVHRVHHREWDLDLAVKSPKPEVFSTESGKLSYEREAQTWIELGLHANIVTCYLVRRIDNIPRLFAEFVADGSLRDWMRDGRLYRGGPEESLARILDVATQFAWGLHHAHRRKLLHLDVKPANVMMAGQIAKVTDFGLAQGVSSAGTSGSNTGETAGRSRDSTKNGAALTASDSSDNLEGVDLSPQSGGMTPGYCSPEQYHAFTMIQQGRGGALPPITLHSDIWSWGVSVLAMFHGRPPCRKGGQTARKVFEVFLKNEAAADRPKVPPALAELLFRCFEPDPRKRPESMEAVADRLTEIYRDIRGGAFPRSKPVSAAWTPESINNRAASMLDLDKPQEAASLLSQAAKMLPWHPEVTYNQTLLAWRSSRLTDLDAVERLETLVKTRENAASAYYALGLLQRERGNPQSAVDAFETALEREDRDDIRRVLHSTEQHLAKSCRCVERLTIPTGADHELLVSENEELFLFPTDRSTYTLRETVTGQERMNFKRNFPGSPSSSSQTIPVLAPSSRPIGGTDESTRESSRTGRIGISDNLQFELVSLENEEGLAMCRVGSPNAIAVFRPIPWARIAPKTVDAAPPHSPYSFLLRDGMIDVIEKRNNRKVGDLFGHEGKVTAMDFEPTDHWIVSGGIDRTLRIWELPSCRCVRTFRSLGGSVEAVYFGKTRKFAFTLIAGGALRIWDIELLTAAAPFRAPILLSLVSSSEEVGRRQAEMNDRCDEIRTAVRNGDFQGAVAAIDKARELPLWETVRGTLDIWDPITRFCRRKNVVDALCTQSFVGHHDTVSSVAISLDGTLGVSAGRDNAIRLWNLADGGCSGVFDGHSDWVRSVVLTQDSKYIISGSWDMSVRVWDVTSGKCMRKLKENIKSLTRLALHPQGRSVAIANGTGAIVLWDMMENKIKGRFQAHDGSVNDLRFSRDGRYLITGGDDGAVHLWDVLSEAPVRTVPAHRDQPVAAVLLTTDLSHAVSLGRGGRLVVWDIPGNKPVRESTVHLSDATALEISADDRFLLNVGKDMKIGMSPLLGGTSRTIEGHPAPIMCIAIDVPGRRFITGCDDAIVRTWDLSWDFAFDGWQPVDARAENHLRALLTLFCPDGKGEHPPVVDAASMRRLRTEMEYRGFGAIPPEEMRSAIDRLISNWHHSGRIVIG